MSPAPVRAAAARAPAAAPAEPGEDELGLAALRDYWTYRPADPRFAATGLPSQPPIPTSSLPPMSVSANPPPSRDGAHQAASAGVASPAPAPQREPVSGMTTAPPQAALREADVEMIQGLIKKLANEVNAADAAQAAQALNAPQAGRPLPAHEAVVGAPPLTAQGHGPLPNAMSGPLAPLSEAADRPLRSIEESLQALRATSQTMRDAVARTGLSTLATSKSATTPSAVVEPQLPPVAPPPVSQGHLYAAAVTEAVHAGRFDVMLEPIMGLSDLRACHYEVSIRLMDPAGEAISAEPADPRLAGTTLLPLLDRTRLSRTASVARRLAERGKSGSVFSAFSGEALTDDGFMTGAAESCREHAAFSGQLVLTFAQYDVRMASPAQLASMSELRSQGFRFALSDVTDLDMDFERLVAAGFAFVKLDAGVFLEGLGTPHGMVPARDVCGYLARMGLELVVDRIDTESERARLKSFGVTMGQGSLFGGPRPMKADALSAARAAAA